VVAYALIAIAAAAALFVAFVTRKRRLELVPVEARGLHEGEWFDAFALANELRAESESIVVRGHRDSYARVEAAVTASWQRYAAQNPPGSRKPYFRSIKVVLRDWHDRQLGKTPP
jgi:hypothetical protein